MPEVELHLFQLPVDVVAVGANVEQLEMRPTDVVWHQNQRVLAENAQKVFVGVAVLFNITVVYQHIFSLAAFDEHRRHHALEGFNSKVANLRLASLAIVEGFFEMVDEEIDNR